MVPCGADGALQLFGCHLVVFGGTGQIHSTILVTDALAAARWGSRYVMSGLSCSSILIADDFEGWRRQVRALLRARPEWQVIAEASDGSEAVRRAEELKPDLILLDIGLPKLNGIEAAQRICQVSPSSKIVFLSQNHDLDVVRAALGTGALGYVLKSDARSELLPAVDAVLRSKQFVSSSLQGQESADTSGEKIPRCHEVLFYSDDTLFLAAR
jgi:DNA-binding NarL/FixJ family response regulator